MNCDGRLENCGAVTMQEYVDGNCYKCERNGVMACWKCKNPNDQMTNLHDSDLQPKPGQYTICISCAALSILDENLRERPLSIKEYAQISLSDARGILFVQNRIIDRQAKRN